MASFPGFGIEHTADTIGTIVGVGAAVGVAAHAVTTNIRKRKLISDRIDRSVTDSEPEGGAKGGKD